MALTSITKDFITKGGVVVQATGVVTSSTGQIAALQVNAGAAISQNLIVGTTASIYGITNLFGGALANAPVTFNSTLNVTGATTLASTLATQFTATNITVTGNETIAGGLSVVGSTVVANLNATVFTATSVTVNGNETITGGLSVVGSTVVANLNATVFTATSITLNGNETISGGLSVTGSTVLTGITATVLTATNLTVNGISTLKGVTSITDTSVASSTATGALRVSGGVGIGGSLFVGGSTYLSGDLYVDGTQFLVNSSSIATGDKTITLATASTSAILASGAGIHIGSTDTSVAYITWTFDGSENWVSSRGVKINGTASNNGTAASGALQVTGGAGIGGGLFVGGTVTATNHVGTIGSAISTIGGGTNLFGGTAGALVYQTAPSVTAFLSSGTNGQLLYMSGGMPAWIAPTGLSAGNATTASNLAGGLANQIPYQSAPGNTVFSAGLTYNGTTLTASNVSVSGTTNATSTITGALQVAGGVGIRQDLWVGGSIYLAGNLFLDGVGLDTISGTTGTFQTLNVTGTNTAITVPNGSVTIGNNLTATTTVITSGNFNTSTITGNALQVTTGGIGTENLYVNNIVKVKGGLFVDGIISGTSVTQLFANNGTFYGVPYGFGALYAGIVGFTPLPQTVLQTTANTSTYAQNNFENTDQTANATADWVATAGDGYDAGNFIDMGITNASWNGTQPNSLGTALVGSDGYVYVQGALPGRGNLVLGASSTSTSVKILAGGVGSSFLAASFNNPNVPALSATSGTLVVTGGIGASSIFVGGTITGTNAVITGSTPANSVSGAVRVTGGVNIGAGLYVTGPTTSTGAIQVGSGATGLLLSNNGVEGAIYTTNVTPSATNYGFATTGASSFVNGTTNVQFAVNDVSTATIQGGLGSSTAYGGQTFIVTANGIGVTGASYFVNNVGIGGTLNVAGVTQVTNATNTTNVAASGALQVTGGLGVAGNAFFGGIVTATTFVGNLTGNVTGNLTGTASLATTASNLALGAAGSIPIQVSPGVTGFIPLGTSGFVLTAGTNTATWTALSGVTAGNATTATNIAGGAQYQIPFQSAAGLTTFSSNLFFNNTTNQLSVTNIYAGGITTSTGQLRAMSGVSSAGTNTGALVVVGGAGVSGNVNVGGSVSAGVSNPATGTPNVTFIGGNTTLASYTSGVISGTALVNLDSWSTSTYRTARYIVQIVDGAKVHVQEMTLFHDVSNVYLNQYGISTNQGELGVFDANLTATPGSVTLNFTPSPSATAMTIKLSRDTISI